MPGRALAVGLVLLVSACDASERPADEITVWRPLAKWSGSGLLQTDPFIGETGQLRVTWEARNRAPSSSGTLLIALHSEVSGRLLARVVDHRGGAGRDVVYVTEDPRPFFLVIESSGLEWSVEVAEGMAATRTNRTRPPT